MLSCSCINQELRQGKKFCGYKGQVRVREVSLNRDLNLQFQPFHNPKLFFVSQPVADIFEDFERPSKKFVARPRNLLGFHNRTTTYIVRLHTILDILNIFLHVISRVAKQQGKQFYNNLKHFTSVKTNTFHKVQAGLFRITFLVKNLNFNYTKMLRENLNESILVIFLCCV